MNMKENNIMRFDLRLKNLILCAFVGIFMLSSCGSVKDIVYFQNKVVDNPEKIDKYAGVVIQPQDQLSIVVTSRNPELVPMFNLPMVQFMAGTDATSSYQQRILGYVVDKEGCIDFPVLGVLKVGGLTRWELSEMIKNKLLTQGLLNDAVVTVEFMNFKFSVLGEVTAPGTFQAETDKVTILQALSQAHDLTIYGMRENVTVIREVNGERTFYQVNLCDVSLFSSPAYYLQQNDIVYVEPNPHKARESTIDDKKLRNASIALSTSSLVVSLATLIVGLIF
jgi:polysaccharide export outer membrane protein